MSENPTVQTSQGAAAAAWSRARQLQVVGLAAVVILAGLLAVVLVGRWREPPAPAPEPPTPPGTFRPTQAQLKTFDIQPVGEISFSQVELTDGKVVVDGDHTVALPSPFTGRVVQVLASPGQAVHRGQVLAVVQALEFAQAQSDLAAAVAQVALTDAAEARKHALYDEKGASLQDWQQAQADQAAARATLAATRDRLKGLGASDAQLLQIEGGHRLPAAAVTSPFDGVVVDRQVGPGQFLQAGAGNPLFTIADITHVWIEAEVRESDAPRLRVGQPIEVSVSGLPGQWLKSTLSYVSAVVDAGTHRLPVRAVLANPQHLLKPESFATVRITTGQQTRSPAVPDSAVVYDGPNAQVWVRTKDARGSVFALRAVRVGETQEHMVQVLEGIAVGEEVVVHGSLFLTQAASGEET